MKHTESGLAILFSDLHASTKQLDNFRREVLRNRESIQLIISAGDFVNMGEPVWFMEKMMNVLDELKLPFIWSPGNNDFGRSYYKLNAKHKSVEGRVQTILGSKFTGVGGSPASWAGQYAGETMIDKKEIGGSIFISHYPPPGVLNYIKEDDLESPAPKKFFSDSPLVHISGHLHYRFGVSYLGQTKVVQLGALETGHYAIMNLENLKVEFKRFYNSSLSLENSKEQI